MKPKRIIVIDDCRLTLAMARDMLENAGFEVLTAESGIEANPHIFGLPRPDLLLIDVELPMLRGDRKVRLLKESKSSRDIPTILMSHKSPEGLETLAHESGAEGWIAKPLRPDVLVGLIRRFLPSTP
ncbi:response regulator [Desulfuromonas sp. TF]|uniref:response regulator n=1 Tax=Desulfuromonas sp. TF TaxID=1232410 RepID=UPI0004055A5E|nr:response regulator [Desulfuromonas sp. TF]